MSGPELRSSRSRAPIIAWDDIKASAKPWFVKDLFPRVGVGFLVGHKGAAKTFVAVDVACRTATDLLVFGRRTEQVGVVYVGAEDAKGVATRIDGWKARFTDASAPLHLYPDGVNLLNQRELDSFCEDLDFSCDAFAMREVRLGLIVVDTLSWCIPGADENDSDEMSRAFRALYRIAQRYECFVLVVAHFGKAGEERGIRGWSGMDAYSDVTISVERDQDDPHVRRMTFSKVKNAADQQGHGFRLESVSLQERDQYGDALTTCVVQFDDDMPTKKRARREAKIGGSGLYLQQAFERLREAGRQVTDAAPDDIPRHALAFRAEDAKSECAITGLFSPDDTPGNRRVKWFRAVTQLVQAGRAKVLGEIIWSY